MSSSIHLSAQQAETAVDVAAEDLEEPVDDARVVHGRSPTPKKRRRLSAQAAWQAGSAPAASPRLRHRISSSDPPGATRGASGIGGCAPRLANRAAPMATTASTRVPYRYGCVRGELLVDRLIAALRSPAPSRLLP